MSFVKKSVFFALTLLISSVSFAGQLSKKNPVIAPDEESLKITLKGKVSNSTDAHFNATLLNENAKGARGDKVDRAFVNKSKVELTAHAQDKKAGVQAKATLRSKLSWGTPRSTTSSESIKFGEALIGDHSHNLERNNIYLQQAWVELDLGKILGVNLWNQTFTVGLFPFELGRGIALGENFAVNPSSIGFYSDSSVDQYAPGAKFSGNLYFDELGYDIYASVFENQATSLKKTAAQIYDQLIVDGSYLPNTQYARGFGDIDYRLAGRLRWAPVDNNKEETKVYFEPYVMYAYDPSQKVEFTSDSKSKLGTFGLCADFQYGSFEFGFDTALNRGRQEVFAWDRNYVTVRTDTTTGALVQVYSHVYDDAGLTTKTVYTGDTTTYRPSSGISSGMNSQLIDGTTKYNASNRFRDAYSNKYKGYMFVADASCYVYKRDLKVAVTGGIASGDSNPNNRTGSLATSERGYKGFVSQQELYSGKRVKSVFVMGPASNLVRLSPLQVSSSFKNKVDEFTNIIFGGFGLNFQPKGWSRKFTINPNVLTYWQDSRSKKYGSTEDASNRLGTEINLCTDVYLADNLKLVAVGAFFIPGKYYADIKGTPLNSDIAEILRDADAGVSESLPTMGNNTAMTLSFGLEYSF